jgi:transcription antitermination factor NusG
VIIEGGPFEGHEAIFVRLSGNERVRVLLKLLRGRQMPVELPTGLIQKKKQRV